MISIFAINSNINILIKNKEMNIQVYISLPMSGHEDTVRKRYDTAVEKVKDMFPKANITFVGPTNINEFDYNGPIVPHDKKWSYYMAKDIEPLLDSTHIFLCKGWNGSKGCRVEYAIAKEINIIPLFEPNYEHYITMEGREPKVKD